jgi:hypothetical protein
MTTPGSSLVLRPLTLRVIPLVVLFAAGAAFRSPLALAHPLAAGLLFLWIASDTRMLALMARDPRQKPHPRRIVAALAVAIFAFACITPPPVRAAVLALPLLPVLLLAIFAAHLGWSLVAAGQQFRRATQERWVVAASELLPAPLVLLAAAELRLLHLALFRWGAAPDVPAGCRGFAYHRHLTPMAATLLSLQVIEVAIHHLLLAHWSRWGAYILFVVSDVGLIYMVGLIKSFRLRPILLTPEGVQVRTGIAIDRFVAYVDIATIETGFDAALIKNKGTLNLGLLAWPNIVLRLNAPMPRRKRLSTRPPITAIAFRLDDPEPFVRALRWRLESVAD